MAYIDFSNPDMNLPEGKIVGTIRTALQYIASADFIQLALTNIFANVDLEPSQKMALKIVGKSITVEASIVSIGQVVAFIYYGKFQDVGAEEAVDAPLSVEQRAACVKQVYLTACNVVNVKAEELKGEASWVFQEPNWTLPF